jgi:hypothetical protein
LLEIKTWCDMLGEKQLLNVTEIMVLRRMLEVKERK